MNIFPNRKSASKKFYEDFNKDFENYKLTKTNSVVKFPDINTYKLLNERLLKTYLNISKKNEFFKKVEETVSKNNSNKFIKINQSVFINKTKLNLFCYELDISLSLKENLIDIDTNNYKIIFNEINNEHILKICDQQILGNLKLIDIVKNIISKVETVEGPNFINIWLFGKEKSIIIQVTYILDPVNDDYLDLIINNVPKSLNNITKEEVCGDISIDKTNEKLLFIIFK